MNQIQHMNKNKLLTLIGFAYKSRKLVSGEGITLEQIKRSKVKLVFLSCDASENTAKRIRDKASARGIAVCECFDRYEMGQAIGKEERVVIGITDWHFVSSMLRLLGGEVCAETKDESIYDRQDTGNE